MRRLFTFFAVWVVFAGDVAAQPLSALEFLDTTGTDPVSRMGWRGTAQNGYFFIAAGNDTIQVKNGTVYVNGGITAAQFTGDGSKLTNIPGAAYEWDSTRIRFKNTDGSWGR